MKSHTEQGHGYIEEKNHASKGFHRDPKLGGGGMFEKMVKEDMPPARKKMGNKEFKTFAKTGKD